MPVRWRNIPLLWRWGVSLLVAAAAVVALVVFVEHNNNNAQAPVSAKRFKEESRQASVVIGQQQAPHVTRTGGRSPRDALVAGVRREMRHQIARGTVDGPLQSVRCGRSGSRRDRIAFHCIAEAQSEGYPFVAVVTPARHEAVFCQKVYYPPQIGEHIPVSKRCVLPTDR